VTEKLDPAAHFQTNISSKIAERNPLLAKHDKTNQGWLLEVSWKSGFKLPLAG
jgi:hypothetical protein